MLLPVGQVGLYAGQPEATGSLGLADFLVTFPEVLLAVGFRMTFTVFPVG